MKDVYPFIDVGSNGSINGFIAAAERRARAQRREHEDHPGPRRARNTDDLRAFLNVVKTTRDRVQTLISQGSTEQQVIDAKPTAEWDAAYGAGFMNGETFTRFTFQDLSE